MKHFVIICKTLSAVVLIAGLIALFFRVELVVYSTSYIEQYESARAVLVMLFIAWMMLAITAAHFIIDWILYTLKYLSMRVV